MKTVSRNNVIYSFSPKHKPAMHVKPDELVSIETEDAFGGQIRREEDSVDSLDWSKVDGATGPVFVEGAEHGDTLAVEVLDIAVPGKGVIVTVPKHGILGEKDFSASTKIVKLSGKHAFFQKVRLKTEPMVGTIGVTPENEIACGSLGRHGGNMDVKELTAGTRLCLPVFVEGGLFAAGDVHAVQADGELCVSAIEIPAEVLVKFGLIKGKTPDWPVLETKDSYAVLACGNTLDDAARSAAEAGVNAFMREYSWSFEEAYMFGSLAIDLKVNQVVDPFKGVRAVISKEFLSMESFLK